MPELRGASSGAGGPAPEAGQTLPTAGGQTVPDTLARPCLDTARERRKLGLLKDKTGSLFSLLASPREIGEVAAGFGVYLTSVYMYCLFCLCLSVLCMYPLVVNVTANKWELGYDLVLNYTNGPEVVANCGYSSTAKQAIVGPILSMTPGSFCLNSPFSSSLACPARCVYNETVMMAEKLTFYEELGLTENDTCATLSPTFDPADTPPALANQTETPESIPDVCLAIVPFCNTPETQCSCCTLQQYDEGTVYPWPVLAVFLLGQFVFLVWVMGLWKVQISTAEVINASTISASDYSVWVRGLPRSCTDNAQVANYFRHYGEVVSATTILDVGNVLKHSRSIQHMRLTLMELKTKAALDAGLAVYSDEDQSPGAMCCCNNFCYRFYWWRLTGSRTAQEAVQLLEEKIQKETEAMYAAEAELLLDGAAQNEVGEAMVIMNYEAHRKNAEVDNRRGLFRKHHITASDVWEQATCQTGKAPTWEGHNILVKMAPDPSDYLWENTSQRGRWLRAVLGWLIFATAVALSCVAQYFMAAEAEEERIGRLIDLIQTELTPAEEVGILSSIGNLGSTVSSNIIGWSYALMVVSTNIIVGFVQSWTSNHIESWSTASLRESSNAVKMSVFYVVNSIVIPIMAAKYQFQADTSLDDFSLEQDAHSLWYIKGGVVTSLFFIQIFNMFLGDLLMLADPIRILKTRVFSKFALTQEELNRLLMPPELSISARLSSHVKTVALGVMLAPVLPISPLISLVGLVLSYWTDKVMFLRVCHLPKRIGYDLTKAVNRLLLLIPLGQLLLMRFVYFEDHPQMGIIFIVGMVFWALFFFLPMRQLLGIKRIRADEDAGTYDQPYHDTLGKQKQEVDCSLQNLSAAQAPIYRPPVPQKSCSEDFWKLVTTHFGHDAESSFPAVSELMEGQLPGTGGKAALPPGSTSGTARNGSGSVELGQTSSAASMEPAVSDNTFPFAATAAFHTPYTYGAPTNSGDRGVWQGYSPSSPSGARLPKV